ncbi:recombinase family protein [uncultured Corynebacterium sp.]|uniref:recombinase family protein n=1 Tax=uncultured Corynebacterium sp. TaxID=159447 RepID=UPI00262C007F|nr:recombinase family protein [uncultured Corynebacterium sp.]
MKVKAAIYLRMSLDIDGRGAGIERQREDCRKRAAKEGWEIVDEYVDNSISASKRNVRRPAYDRMEADFKAGLFNTIICWEFDRLTRQPMQMEQWLDRAEAGELQVVTCTGTHNLANYNGRLGVRILAAVSRGEIELKSARQKRATLQKARKGGPPAGIPPYGYDDEYNVVEDRAETVRGIYKAIQAGVSMADIVRALNGEAGRDEDVPWLTPCPSPGVVRWQRDNAKRAERGLEPKAELKQQHWTHHMVLRIAINPSYAAYRMHMPQDIRDKPEHRSVGSETAPGKRACIVRDDDGEPVQGQWEPIVDKDLWWSVSEILCDPKRDKRRHNRSGRAGLGSGTYICGECGHYMTTLGKSYRCRQCGITRRSAPIDQLVCTVIEKRLSLDDAIEALTARREPTEESKAIEQQIRDQEAKIKRAEADYDDGVITGRDLKRNRDKAMAAIENLRQQQVATLPEATQSVLVGMSNPAEGFKNSSMVTKRAIIDALIEVRVYKAVRGRKQFDPRTVEIIWK